VGIRARAHYERSWEIERLIQLRADVDSSLGRMYTECVRAATLTVGETSAAWLRLAATTEDTRAWMLEELDRWITEKCKGQSGTPGC
jgi:hypothetical protein